MVTVNTIETDQTATAGQSLQNVKSSTTGTDFYSALQYASAVAGPAAYTSTNYLTGGSASSTTQSADIVAAAINASAGTSTMGLTAGGSLGSSLGSSSAYLSGGISSSPSFASTYGGASAVGDDMSSNVEDILSETASSQAYLIGIQAEMGQQQTMYTAISNALNVKYSLEKSEINNLAVR